MKRFSFCYSSTEFQSCIVLASLLKICADHRLEIGMSERMRESHLLLPQNSDPLQKNLKKCFLFATVLLNFTCILASLLKTCADHQVKIRMSERMRESTDLGVRCEGYHRSCYRSSY